MDYKIDKRYFETLVKAKSRSIVGRVLRRIETISDLDTLKQVVKDLIHEEHRDLLTTVEAHNDGIIFSLTKKDSTQQ